MSFADGRVRILFSEDQIHGRVAELGRQLTKDYQDKNLMVVGVLKGSILFFADLIRTIDLPLSVDFLGLSSYQGTESSGVVRITNDLSKSIEGKHVLIVEDIVDTGLTMAFLLENLATRHPATVRICALLEKPSRAKVKVGIDYCGFVIPDEFVVGYGLDLEEKYRNLPFIGVYQS